MKKFDALGKAAFAVLCLFSLYGCKDKDIEKSEYNFQRNIADLNQVEVLGKKIFFDANLSSPAGVSCATCHAQANGFSDLTHRGFSEGAVTGSFVNRNAPSIGYLQFCPPRYYNTDDSTYIGGFFLDGRVNTFEEQAIAPMLNHLEMNNSSAAEIVSKISKADYAQLFKSTFGQNIFNDTSAALNGALKAIASFERSYQLSPFTSKYDYYLQGTVQLTAQEMHGLQLFNDTAKAKCINCHPSGKDNDYGEALFTDFSYDNIGLPHNPASPSSAPDLGLGGTLGAPAEYGRFKVPSLRNVAISAPYFHNGYFNTLEDAIRFYSERDLPGKYPAPEVPQTVNHEELGNLQLTNEEITDIAAFLRTLTDGYHP